MIMAELDRPYSHYWLSNERNSIPVGFHCIVFLIALKKQALWDLLGK